MCCGIRCAEYVRTGRVCQSQPNTQELQAPLNIGSLWRRKRDGELVRITAAQYAARWDEHDRIRYEQPSRPSHKGSCPVRLWRKLYEPAPMTAKECGAKSIKALPPITVDFSAVERRVIAALEGFGQDQQKGVDFHRLRAAEIFDVKPSEVTPAMRRVGKAANFIDAYNSKEK